MENLNKVKHTDVACVLADAGKELPVKEPEMICFTVASERVDGPPSPTYRYIPAETLHFPFFVS